MWKRFKKWLIVKLGGFVEEPEKNYKKVIEISEGNQKIVPITAEIITTLAPVNPWDIECIHSNIAEALVSILKDEGFLEIKSRMIMGNTLEPQKYVHSAKIFIVDRRTK